MASGKAQKLEDIEPGSPIGARIKEAMLAEGRRSVKPTEAALKLTSGHLGRIIKGQRWKGGEIDVELVDRISTLLHVSKLWLVWGEGPMRRNGRVEPTKAEMAFAFCREFGARDDAIQMAWDAHKADEATMSVTDWMNAVKAATGELAAMPRPEVVHDTHQATQRVKNKLFRLPKNPSGEAHERQMVAGSKRVVAGK